MERIMAAQALKSGNDAMANFYKNMKKHLEINPKHPLIINLNEKVKKGVEKYPDLTETVRVLFETTLIRSGFNIHDSVEFASRIERVLRSALGVNVEEKVNIPVPPAPEKKVAKKAGNVVEEKDHDEL